MKKYGIMAFLMALVAIPAFVLVGCGGNNLAAPSTAAMSTTENGVLTYTSVANPAAAEAFRFYEIRVAADGDNTARYYTIARTALSSSIVSAEFVITINLADLLAATWRNEALSTANNIENYTEIGASVAYGFDGTPGTAPTGGERVVSVRAIELGANGGNVKFSDWKVASGTWDLTDDD